MGSAICKFCMVCIVFVNCVKWSLIYSSEFLKSDFILLSI